MNYSFYECYQILEITEECEWSTLRKKYKKLIQKNHPDRFSADSPEHKKAEKAITRYNTAYKQLADYYQHHQALPSRSKTTPDTQVAAEKKQRPRKKPPVVKHENFDFKKTKTNQSLKRTAFTIALVSASVYLYFLFSQTEETLTPPEIVLTEKNRNEASKAIDITQSKIAPDPAPEPEKEIFFTTGSSLGEVISIQGEPSQIDGSIWYYGKSSVTFTNGTVSDWFNHPDDPILVKITNSPALQFQKKNTLLKNQLESSNPLKPYWER